MRAARCRVRLDKRRDLELNLTTSSGSWTSRPSALVHLISKDGTTGTGELAPLPGYSPDEFDAAYEALSDIEPLEIDPPDYAKPRILLSRIEAMVPRSLPSARFALSSAAMDWIGQQAGIPAWELLLPPTDEGNADSVPLCALLPQDNPAAAAKELIAAGYGCVKYKLGADLEQATSELKAISEVLKEGGLGGGCLRLDANQGLSAKQLGDALKALSEYQPDFLEEPLSSEELVAWLSAGNSSPCALGVDESLFNAPSMVKAWFGTLQTRAVVLKPTCLGLARCLDVADQARSVGVDVTVSHCFEGAFGYTAVAAVAIAISSRKLSSGLAPPSTVGATTKRPPPFVAAGYITPWETSGLDTEFAVRG
ncbi:MAG: hypothetical protein H6718_20740 [Polyangiaceae bacterium]|nr:hypothetical protein [Polyangiaceae bacterium]MCB9608793.1 hypothetical protein [Polyangiaceae bacterium]